MDTKVADPLGGALLAGRYRLTRRLARGGTTTVYQARDERLDRSVAVRIINPEHILDADVLERLATEAETVAHLPHPNIVAIFDQGMHEGAPFLVMEYVKGRTLREVIADRISLAPAESLAIVDQVLGALALAHRHGLVHRGIRPETILVAPPPSGSGDLVDAVVKVADFGLARPVDIGRSQTGPLAGAPYVAPELITDGRADTRCDVYSVGVVLFEMLTGRAPFGPEPAGQGDRTTRLAAEPPAERTTRLSAETVRLRPDAGETVRYPGGLDADETQRVAWRHVDEEVPAPSRVADTAVPQRLDALVLQATRRDPAARPRDAAALREQVQAARDDSATFTGQTRVANPTVVASPMLPSQRAAGRAAPGRRPEGAPRAGARIQARLAPAGKWLSETAHRLRTTQRGRRQLTATAVVLGLLLVTGGWWLGFGRYTDAPDLLSLSKDNAIQEAERLGFEVAFGAPIYSEDVPVDTVLAQQPPPGDRLLRDGTITLYLSLGPERYAVPDVIGKEANFAQSLVSAHLVVEIVDGYSDTLPAGYVAATEPEVGTMLPPNGTVKLFVVVGPYPVHVPDVVGKSLDTARDALRRAGFTDITVEERDDDRPKNTVLEQTPAANTGMISASGQAVTLVVSRGPLLAMPDLVGHICGEAAAELEGLGVQVVTKPAEADLAVWVVDIQSVPVGNKLTPGQTVQLTCKVPPEPGDT